MNFIFDWDDGNLAKIELVRQSGRIFSVFEMESVFEDVNKIFTESYPDPVTREPRYQVTGKSATGKVLVITFVYRNDKIRIFNAWKAEGTKLKRYNEKINK